jgi:hypothetical protein
VSNPRGRNSTSYANDAARLPALPTVRAQDPAMQRFVDAVREWIETRSGSRGDQFERTVTLRDLVELGLMDPSVLANGRLTANTLRTVDRTSDETLIVQTPSGATRMTVEAFTQSILNTRLFRDLMLKLNDPKRFDMLPEAVRQVLVRDIAAEAAARGADIRRVETKLQTATESLAMKVEETTAAIGHSVAGVRQTTFATANAQQATAGVVTQVKAAIGDPGSFTAAGVTLEQAMFGIASIDEGLYGQYTVKIDANGYVSGFGLAVEATGANDATSAFLIAADKFAIVDPTDTIADPLNPPTNRIPFGVDTTNNVIYINGNVRINAGGPTLGSLGGTNYTVDLSNEAFTVATNSSGGGGSYGTNTETSVKAYAGTTDDTSNWTFSISGGTVNCTATINGGAGPVSGTGTVTVRITNLTADNGSVTITATKGANSIPVVFRGSKARAGSDGSPATVYEVRPNVGAVSKSKTGVYSPTAIVFTAYSITGTSDPVTYAGRFIIATSNDGSSWTNQYTSASDESSKSYTVPAGITHVRCRLYLAGATTNLVDEESVPIVTDGSDGANGSNGSNGAAGSRGSLDLYISGSSPLTDTECDNAITAQTGSSTKIVGDTVTEYDGSSYVSVKRWNGSSWVAPGVVIDGSLLVTGTVTAGKLAANSVVAANINVSSLSAISANLGTITAGDLTAAKIRTASSGARILINDTATNATYGNKIVGLTSGGVEMFKLDASAGLVNITSDQLGSGALRVDNTASTGGGIYSETNAGTAVYGLSNSGHGGRFSSLRIDQAATASGANTATFSALLPTGSAASTNLWGKLNFSGTNYWVPIWAV